MAPGKKGRDTGYSGVTLTVYLFAVPRGTWKNVFKYQDLYLNFMLDEEGYRPNVGIILCNEIDHVFWARRTGHDGWQFPQGGMRSDEDPEQAMYRELEEEVGLLERHVEVIGRTADWLHYDVPSAVQRRRHNGFRGQKQIWFLLRFIGVETNIRLDRHDQPEFDDWRWIEYWEPLSNIVEFKRDVYQRALAELEPFLKTGFR